MCVNVYICVYDYTYTHMYMCVPLVCLNLNPVAASYMAGWLADGLAGWLAVAQREPDGLREGQRRPPKLRESLRDPKMPKEAQ